MAWRPTPNPRCRSSSPCKWDVVFTDLDLPGLNRGLFALQVKQLSPRTPVVMLTGLIDAPSFPGVDLLIRKPFTRASIAAAVARVTKLYAPGQAGVPVAA